MLQSRQRVASFLVLALVGVLTSLLTAPTAQAASYRYWTYWTASNDAWEFRQIGPAANIPKDGAVEGWKFAISSLNGDEQAKPAFTSVDTFQVICGSTPALPDKKRVALVVDPGMMQAAPQGEKPGALTSTCVQIDTNATGYNVLRSAMPVRTSNGFICGIDGYPTIECADVADNATSAFDPSSTQTPTSTPTSSPLPVVIVVLVLGVVGGLLWRLRGRK
jgi:hypothetical protein